MIKIIGQNNLIVLLTFEKVVSIMNLKQSKIAEIKI